MSSGTSRLAAVYGEVRTSRLKHPLLLPFSFPFVLRRSFRIVDGPGSSDTGDPDNIAKLCPKVFGQPSAVRVPTGSAPSELNKTIKICGVLSGGQAPGGHNVISGIFDYLRDQGSRMYGFNGGAARIMKCKYVQRSTDVIYPYRNLASSHHTSRPVSAPSLFMLQSDRRSSNFLLLNPSISFHSNFGQSIRMKHSLTRSWLVKLWAAEKEGKMQRRKRRPRIAKPVLGENTLFETLSSFRLPPLGSVLNRPVVAEQQRRINRTINRPPPMQFDEGFPSPSSSEEVQLAPLLARPNLLITRDIEWANIMFAFEQI